MAVLARMTTLEPDAAESTTAADGTQPGLPAWWLWVPFAVATVASCGALLRAGHHLFQSPIHLYFAGDLQTPRW